MGTRNGTSEQQATKQSPSSAEAKRDAGVSGPQRSPGPSHPVLQLQRAIGNRATIQLLEARSGHTPAPSGPELTRGLPASLRSGLERLSGLDMGRVQVHYNSPEPAGLHALAYTQGTDIHVGPGQETHLPHEAWHVVQQMQDRVPATTRVSGVAVNSSPSLEQEATRMGAQALAGGSAGGAAPGSPVSTGYVGSASSPVQRIEEAPDEDGQWLSQLNPGAAVRRGEGYMRATSFNTNSSGLWGARGDHAAAGIEYVDQETNNPVTVFTDLTHDGIRLNNGVSVWTGGKELPDDKGVQARHAVKTKLMTGRAVGTTYRVTQEQATAALDRAYQILPGFKGTRPPRGSNPRYKFATRGTAMSTDHYINCARYVEKIFKAAGISLNTGNVVKTPHEVAHVKDSSYDHKVIEGTDSPDLDDITKSLHKLTTPMSWLEKKRIPSSVVADLSTEEIKAINTVWAAGLGGLLNNYLRNRLDDASKDELTNAYGSLSGYFGGHMQNLNAALDKIPAFVGTSYRYANFGDPTVFTRKIQPGDLVSDPGYIASSVTRGSGTGGTDWGRSGRVYFQIKGETGRDITPYSTFQTEREVLFRPGTVFKVRALKVRDKGKTAFVMLEEVTAPPENSLIKSMYSGEPLNEPQDEDALPPSRFKASTDEWKNDAVNRLPDWMAEQTTRREVIIVNGRRYRVDKDRINSVKQKYDDANTLYAYPM